MFSARSAYVGTHVVHTFQYTIIVCICKLSECVTYILYIPFSAMVLLGCDVFLLCLASRITTSTNTVAASTKRMPVVVTIATIVGVALFFGDESTVGFSLAAVGARVSGNAVD